MRYSTISQIGSFTAVNGGAADYFLPDPTKCTGGDDAPLRTTVEPAPGLDGALILPPLDDAQIITLAGPLIITSAGDEAGYFAAMDTLFAALKTALAALKVAPDDLVSSDGTVKVWKYAGIDSGWEDLTKTVTFGLVVDVFA
jgi:hypothetical protein